MKPATSIAGLLAIEIEQGLQLLLGIPLPGLDCRRRRQGVRDAGTQRVIVVHVIRKAGIRTAGDHEPDAGGRPAGKQPGDAGPSPGRHGSAFVLIEPVHHDDKPPPPSV
ncbi:MAG TPA: hypothetical protein VHN16_06675 [Streptosporangiaceae bacterium]|nr:hypothetical protein [Streptosporangiaceae bacterium]